MSNTHHQHKYHKSHPYQQHEWDPQHIHGHHNGSAVLPYHDHVAADETYGTYVDDEYFDIHDYDENTDDDVDDATDDDTDDNTIDDTDDDTEMVGAGTCILSN